MGESPSGRALQAYQGLELHPEIDRAAGALYRGSHYANAVEDAVTALNALVRLMSGVEDVDGSKLMQQVFRPEGPLLRFNALADQSDIHEQRGYMMMFSGAVAGLRNPRAHKLVKDDPERAATRVPYCRSGKYRHPRSGSSGSGEFANARPRVRAFFGSP